MFLINDILDLSKIEAGRMELELTDFHLPTALDNALMLVRERAGRRNITLQMSVDERLGEVRADERKIRQVVLNLLSNAIKFTPEGGRIVVGAVPRETGLWRYQSATPGSGSRRRIREQSSRSSARSGPVRRSRRGRGSGWPFAASSSNCTAGESGSRVRWAWARPSRSRSRCAVANELILVVEDHDQES